MTTAAIVAVVYPRPVECGQAHGCQHALLCSSAAPWFAKHGLASDASPFLQPYRRDCTSYAMKKGAIISSAFRWRDQTFYGIFASCRSQPPSPSRPTFVAQSINSGPQQDSTVLERIHCRGFSVGVCIGGLAFPSGCGHTESRKRFRGVRSRARQEWPSLCRLSATLGFGHAALPPEVHVRGGGRECSRALAKYRHLLSRACFSIACRSKNELSTQGMQMLLAVLSLARGVDTFETIASHQYMTTTRKSCDAVRVWHVLCKYHWLAHAHLFQQMFVPHPVSRAFRMPGSVCACYLIRRRTFHCRLQPPPAFLLTFTSPYNRYRSLALVSPHLP